MYKMLGLGEAKLKVTNANILSIHQLTRHFLLPNYLLCAYNDDDDDDDDMMMMMMMMLMMMLMLMLMMVIMLLLISQETLELAGQSVVEMMKPYSMRLMGRFLCVYMYISAAMYPLVVLLTIDDEALLDETHG